MAEAYTQEQDLSEAVAQLALVKKTMSRARELKKHTWILPGLLGTALIGGISILGNIQSPPVACWNELNRGIPAHACHGMFAHPLAESSVPTSTSHGPYVFFFTGKAPMVWSLGSHMWYWIAAILISLALVNIKGKRGAIFQQMVSAILPTLVCALLPILIAATRFFWYLDHPDADLVAVLVALATASVMFASPTMAVSSVWFAVMIIALSHSDIVVSLIHGIILDANSSCLLLGGLVLYTAAGGIYLWSHPGHIRRALSWVQLTRWPKHYVSYNVDSERYL